MFGNNSIFSRRNESFLGADDISALLGDNPFLGDDEGMGDDDGMNGPRRNRTVTSGGPVQEQIYPFARTSLAALAGSDITGRPQRPFRTERLAIDSTIASDFTFSRLLIGQDNMFVANADLSCQLFCEAAVSMRLRGYIAQPGIDITISVVNRNTVATLLFSGCIVGSTLVSV
jgi:hypothetical protein